MQESCLGITKRASTPRGAGGSRTIKGGEGGLRARTGRGGEAPPFDEGEGRKKSLQQEEGELSKLELAFNVRKIAYTASS